MSLEVFCNSLFPGWSAQNQLRQGVIAWDDNEKGLGRLLLLAAVLLLFAQSVFSLVMEEPSRATSFLIIQAA